MRKVRTLVASILRVLGVVVLLVVATSIYASLPKTDYFFLADAEFASTNHAQLADLDCFRKDDDAFEVHGHRLKRGTGVILAKRRYSPGDIFTIDDETYTKLTIWMREIRPGVHPLATSSDVIAYFSSGGSAWPKCGCGRLLKQGELRVQAITSDRIKIDVDFTTNCNEKRQIGMTESMELSRKPFEELTNWMGIPGSHIYQETYYSRSKGHEQISDRAVEEAKRTNGEYLVRTKNGGN